MPWHADGTGKVIVRPDWPVTVQRNGVSVPDATFMASVATYEEKGSDVNLATFLLLDAFNRESDIAVVVSNDSDLAEPIRVLMQKLDVPVGLVNPHPAKYRSRDLLRLEPLFFKQVRSKALGDCQFPRVLYDADGEIRCPDDW